MSEFQKYAKVIGDNFDNMAQQDLHVVDLPKNALWNAYQAAFPEGTNELYKENLIHDCNTCKNYIRNIGSAISIQDGTIRTIWDNTEDKDIAPEYKIVSEVMRKLVQSAPIYSPFIRSERKYGHLQHKVLQEDNSIVTFDHFEAKIPTICFSTEPSSEISKKVSSFKVFERGMKELSYENVDMIIELIENNSIYNALKDYEAIKTYRGLLQEFSTITDDRDKEIWLWKNSTSPAARLRNSVIGTLIIDLEEGKALEEAVKSYEAKVAPSNYKRPKALATEKMKKDAIKAIDKAQIRDSLPRRHAVTSDVSINDVLFADRNTKLKDKDPLLDALGASENLKINYKSIQNAPHVGIEEFVKDYLPGSKKLSIVAQSSLQSNIVNISAPVNSDAPNILKWDNNFSWSYNGNLADSDISRNVQKAGGSLEGVLRFSLQWNEEGQDNTDLDAHCLEKCSGVTKEIYYNEKRSIINNATLDIDVTRPNGEVAVENIVWKDITDGEYHMFVRDYSGNGTANGFRAEVVFNDITYSCNKQGNISKDTNVCTVTVKNGEMKIEHHMPCNAQHDTELVPVKLMCLSPNYWSDNAVGNKHYFFICNDNNATVPFRGFYNEFLRNDFNGIRKAMDMLADNMQVEPLEDGLRGYGFSSSKRTSFTVKLDDKLINIDV